MQRRGRVLRRALGRDRSVIHDPIVIPIPLDPEGLPMGDISDAEGSILMNELRRAEIFADAAGNAVEASASYTMRVRCSRPTARTARQLHRKTRTNGCKVVGLILERRLLRLSVVTGALPRLPCPA